MRLPKMIPLQNLRIDRARLASNKNGIMLAVAIVVGLGGMYLANTFIQKRIANYEAKIKGEMKTTQVVVPKMDLPQGAIVSSDNMAIRDVPALYVHRDVVTPDKFSVAEGQRLSFQLDSGKPLLWAHLEGGSAPTFSGKLPNGKRAMTISVDDINSISGMLQPRDKVDIILTMTRQGGNRQKLTFPLMQDVLVLATGTKVNHDKGLDPKTGQPVSTTYRTATLLVNQDEAKKIILAQDSGKLTLILRHPDDNKPLPSDRITVAHLLNEGGPTKRVTNQIEFIVGGR